MLKSQNLPVVSLLTEALLLLSIPVAKPKPDSDEVVRRDIEDARQRNTQRCRFAEHDTPLRQLP